MATTVTLTTNAGSSNYTLSTGARGPQGDAGDTGPTGPQGPTGATGSAGATGATGPQGDPGKGVPVGGTTGQVLTKSSNVDYETTWDDAAAAIDNAALNTAAKENPAATRYALAVERKQNFGASILSMRGATSKNLLVVTFGDSLVAQGTPLNLSGVIPFAGGFCEAEQSINVSGGTSTVDDWTYPGGKHAVIPSGGTRRWGRYYVTASAYPFQHASTFKIYYIRGTGTLKLRSAIGISSTFADISGHTAIDCSTGGAAGTVGVYTCTLTGQASNYYRLDTECTSGTVKILCVQALADTTGTRDSYHLSCLGLGGSSDSQWINCTQANWTAVLTAMSPHLIVFKAADFHIGTKTTSGDWATVLDRIRTAAPNAVMLLIDGHPHSANTDPENDNSGWSAGMKAYAALNAPMVQFVECRKFWPSYADMLTNNLISVDGIHLVDPNGRAFESALTLDHVSTITVPAHINELLSTKIQTRLPGAIGTIQSGFGSGPEWWVTGDLYNSNGYIGIGNQYGTAAQVGAGPHLTSFSTANSNGKVASGFAWGLNKTSHQIFVCSRINNRMVLGNLGNVESAFTRDTNAQVEIMGTSTTVPTFSIGAVASQTADMAEFRSGVSASAVGTQLGGITKDGIYYHTPVAHTATTAAIPLTSKTNSLTTTAPAQAITLADGIAGQTKTIMHVATSGGGTAVLTPATKTGYTTITFANVGDTATLKFYTTYGWMIESIRGAVAA